MLNGETKQDSVSQGTIERQRQTGKSEAVCKAADALIPGGAQSAFRAWYHSPDLSPAIGSPIGAAAGKPIHSPLTTDRDPSLQRGWPVAMVKGKGAFLIDADGNESIDYIGAHGTLILGHADQRVVAAISKAASKGAGFGTPSEIVVRLAELIVSRFPSIDMVELFDTPTEALTCAAKVARASTNRERIVTFQGCWHSRILPDHSERFERSSCSARQSRSNEDIPADMSFGSPARPVFNDIVAVERLFDEFGSAIAGVVVEPVGMSKGLVAPAAGFLQALRSCCDAHGALLIFDETATGLRIASGGAASSYGVTPDLTLLGPSISGGLPLGAVGGRRELLTRTLSGQATSAIVGSHVGNLLAIAAGIATIEAVGEPGFYEELSAKAARLDEGLRAATSAHGLQALHARVGSVVGLSITPEDAIDEAFAQPGDTPLYSRFHRAMWERGILLSPSEWGCLFVSLAHTDEQIDQTIATAHDVLCHLVPTPQLCG